MLHLTGFGCAIPRWRMGRMGLVSCRILYAVCTYWRTTFFTSPHLQTASGSAGSVHIGIVHSLVLLGNLRMLIMLQVLWRQKRNQLQTCFLHTGLYIGDIIYRVCTTIGWSSSEQICLLGYLQFLQITPLIQAHTISIPVPTRILLCQLKGSARRRTKQSISSSPGQ